MLWTDERLQQVIAQYTPVLYLHEDERYLPCSVDWYIHRSQMWLEEPIEHVSELYVACQVSIISTTPNTCSGHAVFAPFVQLSVALLASVQGLVKGIG